MFASTLRRTLGASAALALVISFGIAAHAQDKMSSGAKKPAPAPTKMEGKMAGPVYACTKCKVYTTPEMAKHMGYRDAMGHKLTKMSQVPAGYTDATKMGKNMDKMSPKMKTSGSKM